MRKARSLFHTCGVVRREWHRLPPVPSRAVLRDGGSGDVTAVQWLALCRPLLPRELVQRLFRERKVRVMGSERKVGGSAVVEEGEVLCLPEAVVRSCRGAREAGYVVRGGGGKRRGVREEEKEWVKGLVLYRDPELLMLNKPGGVCVKGEMQAVMDAALWYGSHGGPRVVQMLEREVSGVICAARTEKGACFVRKLLEEKRGAAEGMDLCEAGDPFAGEMGLERKGCVEHVRRGFRFNPRLHPYWALEMGSMEQLSGRVYAAVTSSILVTSGKLPNKIVVAEIERTFWALLRGGPPKEVSGLISAPLRRVVVGMEEVVVLADRLGGEGVEEAMTEYRVLGSSILGCTWMELKPLTDCKHQVRVHCASVLGMPILGDYEYGWEAHAGWPPRLEEGEEEEVAGRRREAGDMLSTTPLLHLHCRCLSMPNVDGIFFTQKMRRSRNSAARPFSNKVVERLKKVIRVTASLPPHMLASWNLKHLPNVFLTNTEYPGWRDR